VTSAPAPAPVDPEDLARDREAALALLHEWVASEALRRHAYAVEASVRAYARSLGEDEAAWGCVALLHDFDWERHPSLEQHPQDGEPVLAAHGYPDWFRRAVLSHADHVDVPRESPLEHHLYACDELSGFVHACGLVRPEGLTGLQPKSVRKKLKQRSFAAGVNRDDVVRGAEEIGLDLDEHIANVVAALQPIAKELGLPG
jgi:predicted hydrolase (HD superfamily)